MRSVVKLTQSDELHNHMRFPPIVTTISSRCQRALGGGRLRFKFLAICGPNLIVQQRMFHS
jgi:hypothetical protein